MAEERNALGLTAEEVEKELRLLENQYKMFEKTIKETERTMKSKVDKNGEKVHTKESIEKQIQLIKNAQDDTVEKYALLGGDTEKLKSKRKRGSYSHSEGTTSALDLVSNNEEKQESITAVNETIDAIDDYFAPPVVESAGDGSFDLIPLPSNGECYKNKISKMPVAPLCANDENMTTSPNLYKDNLILDYILRAKMLNSEIDPLDMLEGDREAILLYLRIDGYGPEYPITATDNATGKKFDAVVDLTQLTYKQFKLKGDANGWFSFTLPKCGSEVKFRFLTHRDTLKLHRATELEDEKIMKDRIAEMVSSLDEFIEVDKKSDSALKTKIRQAIRTLDNWQDDMEDDELKFNHSITNRLELEVMSIDGNMNRDYIRKFIRNMSVKDSTALRNYIGKNEPGINHTFTIEKPESLGGGSQEVFLQFDKYIFLNIA